MSKSTYDPTYGYHSTAAYDYRLGLPTRQTDIAGAQMRREYDENGRLVRVWAPYDDYPSGIPSLEMEYFAGEFPQRAVTHNKVSFDPDDTQTIATVIITDGLRRVIQTKATGEVYDPVTGDTDIGMTVSGLIEYDQMGRTRAEHQPWFEEGEVHSFSASGPQKLPTTYSYDIEGRVTEKLLPDASRITTEYRTTQSGRVTVTTDPEGRVQRSVSEQRSAQASSTAEQDGRRGSRRGRHLHGDDLRLESEDERWYVADR